ncbi:MAG TPA: DUF4337 family protein, partial [Gemmataceae bacterium]|nr:DUF4337 family protein [Gemmataceae bacterium]
SRELTLSQYHRALAAQNQSKAGDQWNFFQAKRNRRTSHETTVDVLQATAEPAPVDAAALEATARFLEDRFRRVEAGASHLLELLGSTKTSPSTGNSTLHEAAGRLQQTVREEAKRAQLAQNHIHEVLSRDAVRSAWTYLIGNEQPKVQLRTLTDPQIDQAEQAIRARLPEEDTASLFRKIPQEEIGKAIATAEANAQVMEHTYEPISEAIGQIQNIVDEQIRMVRPVQAALWALETAATDLASDASQEPVRATVAELTRSGQRLRIAADRLSVGFKATWHAYQARRYKTETDYNRQAAEMYEIQVRKSSVLSERHRDRSKNFFYGMLAAQAGVTIATFSLAMRHKSLLWGLACLAGASAVAIGLYVHLKV